MNEYFIEPPQWGISGTIIIIVSPANAVESAAIFDTFR